MRSILTLLTGAALAQLIPLLLAPLLTRLYTPAEYGLFAFYVGVMSNLAVIATARYELAIVLPKTDEEGAQLLGVSLWIAGGLTLLLLVTAYAAGAPLATLLGHRELSLWLPVLAVTVGVAGAVQAFTQWANRRRQDRAMAISRFSQSGMMVGVQLWGGWAHWGVGGLIFGQLAGQVAALFVLVGRGLGVHVSALRSVQWLQAKRMAMQYREFPTVNALHAFVFALQETGALWLLAHWGGPAALGFYGMTMRILKTPVGLIGGVVGQVFYQRLAEAKNQHQALWPIVKRMAGLLFALAVLPVLVLAIWGDVIFAWMFGAQWLEAGRYAQLLAPFILFYFVVSPLSMVPLVLGKQRIAFFFAMVGIAAYLGALAVGVLSFHSVRQGMMWISIVMTGYYLSYLFWLWRTLTEEDACLS